MTLNLDMGDRFPDQSLVDDTGRTVTIAEVAAGRPLLLAFFRGPW